VNSNDRFLFHKTSYRDTYDNARRAASDCDDVLLWNERGEVTETTIANIVVEIAGKMVTPDIYSGLLPGVMRRYLLRTKTIREGIIRIEDIKKAEKIWRINSIRKWEPCNLLGRDCSANP